MAKDDFTKISVHRNIEELASKIMVKDNRPSVSNVVSNLIITEAKRLKIGTRRVDGTDIKIAPVLPQHINRNKANEKKN